MKKSNYTMLMATAIMTVLTACSKPVDVAVDPSAKETTIMSEEASEDETTATVSETIEETEPTTSSDIFSGEWVTHTVGVINVDLPESFLSEEVSQMVEGIDTRMLISSDPEQLKNISVAYYGISEDSRKTFDMEQGLQGMVDNMLNGSKANGVYLTLQSETETQQIEFAGRTWGHRNVVVSSRSETVNADIYATVELKQGAVSIILMNKDGTNEDIIERLDSIISFNDQ